MASRSALRHAAIACLGTRLLLLLGASTAAGQPTVRVRAECRIELRTEHGADADAILGVLRDDLGAPLAGETIAVRFREVDPEATWEQRAIQTGGDGTFRVVVASRGASYNLTATFEGSASYERVSVTRVVDLNRADVRLHVDVPNGGRLDLDQLEHVIVVRAQSDANTAGLRLSLRSELDRVLAMETTDAQGRAQITIDSTQLGPPGPGRLSVRSEADEGRSLAQTEVPIVRFRRTTLDLIGPTATPRVGEQFEVTGQLRDRSGPLQGRAIGIFANEEHATTVLTGPDGEFTAVVQAPEEARTLVLIARFDSDSPGRLGSESSPAIIEIEAPLALGALWLLVPVITCITLLAAMSRSERRRRPLAESGRITVPGIRPAAATVRSPSRFDVTGRVLDSRDDESVAEAMVTLVAAGQAISIPVDPSGCFHLNEVAEGDWTLRVEAQGYLPVEGQLHIPHRGQFSQLVVRLQSMRAIAGAAFRRLALRLLPEERRWPIWTNREVVKLGESPPAARATLNELVDRVEVACYASAPPSSGDVDAIENLARRTDAALQKANRGPEGRAIDT